MAKESLKKVSGNLASLARLATDNWFSNPDNSSIWLRIYTALLIPHDKFEKAVVDFLPDPDKHEFLWNIGEEKVAFGFGSAKGMKIPVFNYIDMFAQESGETIVKINYDQSMNDAMRMNDAFLEYWTALEVICNGKANRIKTRLQKIYKLINQQEAGAATGLNTLAKWRHEYFHLGIRPSLSPDVERYIQLMFLDLLRFEIDLSPRGHLAAIQAAEGYDLSPIGLEDKRTKDQREAAETRSARPRM